MTIKATTFEFLFFVTTLLIADDILTTRVKSKIN